MLEPLFSTKFALWFEEHKHLFPSNLVWETKVARGGTFNLKQWRENQFHQPRSLKDATTDVGVFWKISDSDIRQKPIDGFFISRAEGYLVIYFDMYKIFFCIPEKGIPKTNSISYYYCNDHFRAYKLLPKKEVKIVDF